MTGIAFVGGDDACTQLSDASELWLLRAGFGELNDGVIITRVGPADAMQGECVCYVNAAFERLTGWHRTYVIGRPLAMLDGPGTSEDALRALQAAAHETRRVELLQYTREGREFWAEVTLSPIVDDSGRRTHWMRVYRDLTERRRLEERLLHAQKMDTVGRLAGGVAHDFNNVLTAIQGFSDLLLHEVADRSRALDEVREIRNASDRAAALTRQLLAFSRKQCIRPRHVDLNALIRDIERLVRRVIHARVHIRTECAEPLPFVYADPIQLEQVLLNLVINASEAMPSGGVLSIETHAVAHNDRDVMLQVGVLSHVCLRVADTGAGMDGETRAQIFEPFFTTKDAGTGLGLSTVHDIVRQAGGHIHVQSEVGVGSTFELFFPVSVKPADDPPLYARVDVSGGPETVLVVEDDPAVRNVVRALLARRGYTVLLAADGAQADAVLTEHAGPVQLLITDVGLPEENGVQISARLSQRIPGLRVLYMSGYADDSMFPRVDAADAQSLLEKPFADLTLARRVRTALDAPTVG